MILPKVALVTGASAGIGAAISKELVKIGMTVVGAARRKDMLTKMENELSSEKGIFVPYKCDITKNKDIYDMFAFIKNNYKGVDVCVNNAGSILRTSLVDGTPEEWKYLMDLNVVSHCLCSQLTIHSLQERNLTEGHIFNICSLSGTRIFPLGFTHFYSSTKYALHAATEGLRQELKIQRSKIKVTEVSPGLVKTDLIDKMPLDKVPVSDIEIEPLLPEDIATVVMQVLSLPSRVEIREILMGPTVDVPC